MLAIGFYAAYAPPPLALYGTATILILAFITRFLPIAYTNSAAGMRSINPEMEEAVRILGGGRLLAIRQVVAPLLKRSSRAPGSWSSSRRRASCRPRSSSSARTRGCISVLLFE